MSKTKEIAEQNTAKAIVQQFNISTTDAEKILYSFKEVAERIFNADVELNNFVIPDKITKEACVKAKKLRLLYSKIRSKGDEIHKEVKAQVLLRSKAIDGVKNIFKLQVSEREEKLKKIEKHFEILEEQRKEALSKERAEKLEELNIVETEHLNLGDMEDEVWESFYAGKKSKHQVELEAKKKEEEERKKQKIENEKIRKENEKLKKKQKEQLAKTREKENQHQEELEEQKKENEKVEAELKAKEEEEERKKQEELTKKKEEEKAKKNKRYLDFLKKNKVTNEELENHNYILKREENIFRLYKLIDEIKII